MLIFIDNKSAKFCQITLHIKRFIRERKVVPFSLPQGVDINNSLPESEKDLCEQPHDHKSNVLTVTLPADNRQQEEHYS